VPNVVAERGVVQLAGPADANSRDSPPRALGDDATDQRRITLRHPAEREEGGRARLSSSQLQQQVDVRSSGWASLPRRRVARGCRTPRPGSILDVDRQRLSGRSHEPFMRDPTPRAACAATAPCGTRRAARRPAVHSSGSRPRLRRRTGSNRCRCSAPMSRPTSVLVPARRDRPLGGSRAASGSGTPSAVVSSCTPPGVGQHDRATVHKADHFEVALAAAMHTSAGSRSASANPSARCWRRVRGASANQPAAAG